MTPGGSLSFLWGFSLFPYAEINKKKYYLKMAGGYDFGNPEFDRDDYDDDGDIDDKLPMMPDDDTQRIALNQSCHIII